MGEAGSLDRSLGLQIIAVCNHARDQQRRECLNPSGWSPQNIVVTLEIGRVLVIHSLRCRMPEGNMGCVNVVGQKEYCMQFFRELANTFVQVEWLLVWGALCLGDKGSTGIKAVGKKARTAFKCISQQRCEPVCDWLRGQQHNMSQMSNWAVSF